MSGSAGAVSGCTSGTRSAGVPEHDSGVGAAIHRWPHSSELEMAPLPTAVACGRLHARNVLHEWRLGHAAEDASILVSELLTNSVKASFHQGTPVRLRLLADHSQLIIEAWDRNPRPPQLRQPDYADESGRGLNVIAAIAVRWGHYRSGNWKAVWAEMLTGTGYPGAVT
jgi:anti-sigma regulatory factor (Ser/Thr protein kinase)